MELDTLKDISIVSPSKIVLLVMDGLGGLPHPETGKTELETARTPNMDELARRGICGLTVPVGLGITPGSGPGHLALFGYDPLRFEVGRGVLEAIGIGFDVKDTDVAARGNFCSIDAEGRLTDRRAGRIPTEKSTELCKRLSQIKLEGAQLFVLPVKEHRFAVVLRGEGLSDALTETDPQQVGVPPLDVKALKPEAERTAQLFRSFVDQAKQLLAESQPANMLLLRGFAKHPHLPQIPDIYKLRAAAIATYPMYRGLASLAGMEVLSTGSTLPEEIETVRDNFDRYDYFFIHFKATDAAGEDGDFERKVRAIESVDEALPALMKLAPDVLMIAGDHSTPALLKAHSWHPVPFLLSSTYLRPDAVVEFGEHACATGSLGSFPAQQVMALAMGHALKLNKFGA